MRRTAHTIISGTRAGGDIILTASDDLLVGRARVDHADDRALTTRTSLPLAPIYHGVTLANASFEPLARVRNVANGRITVATPIADSHRPARGEDVWLVNVGPGDQFELPALHDDDKR